MGLTVCSGLCSLMRRRPRAGVGSSAQASQCFCVCDRQGRRPGTSAPLFRKEADAHARSGRRGRAAGVMEQLRLCFHPSGCAKGAG